MKYRITHIDDSNGWIFISAENSFVESTLFVELLESIATCVGGKIFSVGEIQYKISNMPYDLTFQWDDLFGIVVLNENKEATTDILNFFKDQGIMFIL